MIRRKVSPFIPVGLLMLSAGLLLHNWTHGNYWHFAGGFLLGAGIVLIIGGTFRQSRGSSKE
ncbi:MAG: hypothetical protein ACLQBK_16870 [Candidatus Sulfotelmatobacter sp.]